ncbi:leucine-rich repeat extensin-like protein 3 [Telopea speciosissima]|uniref:leucine-rich repeat extensin-like protein 3 n=1 Tax=Telopea speciosissima TaxID=54955 RepID=UPI001CC421D6|nr:leucine-rich repeat extensin-like protein 3 [Telopea speciosissima]
MSWLLIFMILICFLFNNLSEAKNEKKLLPSAVVVGTVYCDTCFQQDFSKSSYFISDASVAVQCGDGSSKPSFSKEVKTNKQGEFRVDLPFTVSKHVKRIKKCSVKLISSSEPFCSVASRATSSSLHLKSRKQGVHIFSAGFFTFKPLREPEMCSQRPRLETSKEQQLVPQNSFLPSPGIIPTFPPVTQDPTIPNVPSLTPTTPYLSPLPILPNLPPLPPLPVLPPLPPLMSGQPILPPLHNAKMLSGKTVSTHQTISHPTFLFPPLVPPIFPTPPPFGIPNPFQPPPLLPPLPFQPPPPPFFNLPPVPGLSPPPSPPPFNLPPVPGLSPPPSSPPPFFNLPPIPGLSPPPSPPPPPRLPFPFPPFPFPPPGGFPGIPPAPPRLKEPSP